MSYNFSEYTRNFTAVQKWRLYQRREKVEPVKELVVATTHPITRLIQPTKTRIIKRASITASMVRVIRLFLDQ